MTIQKRNIVTCIILCFVTCGIYIFIWDYKLWSEMYKMNNMPSTAGKDLLLGFVTCGIYFIYMYYKMGKLEDEARKIHNLPPKDSALIYLLFGIFTGGIVANAVAQNSINKDLIDAHNNNL